MQDEDYSELVWLYSVVLPILRTGSFGLNLGFKLVFMVIEFPQIL